MNDYEAVVVGGGIVGSSVAYHLARAGVETVVVDRDDDGRATNAGAGIVAPATSSRTESTRWFEFAVDAADYYPGLAADLADAGYDHGYSETELVAIAVDDSDRAALHAAKERSAKRTDRYGFPEPDSVSPVAGEVLRELFPPVVDGARGLHFENAGRVDGARFAAALLAAGTDAGLTIRDGDVTDIRTSGGAVAGVDLADGTRIDARNVVVAGGAWSASFGADLGVEVPVEPHRGQIAHLDTDPIGDVTTADWPVVKGFRGHYMVPWPDGRIAVGATRESDAEFAPHATLGGIAEVSNEALRVAPGLSEARHVETRVGLRPVSADRNPVLGPVPGVEGAHLATGHGATGLQLGPYSGKLVAEAVRGAEPPELAEFGVGRF